MCQREDEPIKLQKEIKRKYKIKIYMHFIWIYLQIIFLFTSGTAARTLTSFSVFRPWKSHMEILQNDLTFLNGSLCP